MKFAFGVNQSASS